MAASKSSSSSSGSYEVHIEGVDEVVARIGIVSSRLNTSVASALNAGAKIVETSAKSKVKVKTGRLKDSIHTIPASPENLEAQVVADTNYASYIEKGTAPHVIVATNAAVLHFQLDGDDAFAASVQHPGSAAAPFMEPALDENTEDIKASVMLALQMELLKL